MAELWKEQVGTRAPRVTVFERADKDRTVWLRWYVDRKPLLEITHTRSIRDDRGRMLKRQQDAARLEALEKWRELHGEKVVLETEGPLTWAQGIALAFSPRGCYPQDPDEDAHTADMANVLDEAGAILGEDTPWEDITPGRVRSLWRTLRTRYAEGGGYRKAEKMVAALFAVARWLQEEYPEQRFPRPMRYWRRDLKTYWRKTGAPISEQQPAHTSEEVAALFAGRRKGDPRVALALVLGAELRGGQVVETMRSHYDPEGGLQMKRGGLGRIDVPFVSDQKKAPTLYLNWRERLDLERAMRRGYLSDVEAAYQAGEIEDYAFFPEGKLREGKAVVDRASTPTRQETLVGWLHDLERAVGVEVVTGRGWHGLRREMSDRYEDKTDDERVKDTLGGWTKGSNMRRQRYQRDENPEVLEEAARLREQHRPGRKEEDS